MTTVRTNLGTQEAAKRLRFAPVATIAATNVQDAIAEVAAEAGSGPGGSGDMTKAVYDTNADGKIDVAAGGAPAGGTANQVLTKIDGTSYNYSWQPPAAGAGDMLKSTYDINNDGKIDAGAGGVLAGGLTNQILAKNSNTDNDLKWIAQATGNVIAGGTTNQALVKNSNADFDLKWATLAGSGDMLTSTYDTVGGTNGIIDVQAGGTGLASYALGDILYASAGAVLAKLAGNTINARRFLRQTGTGAVSAAPVWDTLALADVSGAGDVVGPASSTDNALAVFNGTTGKIIKSGAGTVLIDASGDLVPASSTQQLGDAGGTAPWGGLLLTATATINWGGGTVTLTGAAGPLLTSNSPIVLPADPVTAFQAATKQYVDAVAAGLDPKGSVRAATTANISLTGAQTIDGVAVVASDRVLVKNQTTASQNGIYVAAAGAWARSTDNDNWLEVPGAFCFVEVGTVNSDTGWVCTADQGGTIGTTSMTWTQFAGPGSYVGTTPISVSGNTISLQASATDKVFGRATAGSGNAEEIVFTSQARQLCDDASFAAMRATLGIDTGTGRGDAIYTILNTDSFVYTNAAFTASRAFTLPAANTLNAGQAIIVADLFGGVTSVNTLVLTRAGADTINGGTTFTIDAARDACVLISDGVSKWFAGLLSPNALSTAGRRTMTGGNRFTPNSLGTVSSGTVTPDAYSGNYQYYTNNGAHTLAPPANDCALDILVTNGATAGAITAGAGQGWTLGASTGDALTTVNAAKFIISIRRINSIATYTTKALQ